MRHVGIIGTCVLLTALTLIAYLPVRQNGLVDVDDELYISDNPEVLQGLSWDGVRWAFTKYHGTYWMPLAWLSLQADAHLFTGRTRDGRPNQATITSIHTHNLLWHLGSVLLLFGLWQRLTGMTFRSFVVAGLFAVHPMRVESVAWAAERKDVMSVFFGILTLWAYVRYTAKPGMLRYLAAVLPYALSLMCKPMLMTLPFVLLLVDYWPLRRLVAEPATAGAATTSAPATVSLGRLILEKVPFVLLAVAEGIVTQLVRSRAGNLVSWELIPLSARLGTAATAYGWYVLHTIWPMNLAALYPHPGRDWSVAAALEGLILLGLITAVAILQARRRRWLLVGWCWFVGTLTPVLGLSLGGGQAWADRFCYWPHIGLLVVIVWGLGEIVERWHIPRAVVGPIAIAVLIGFAWLTWIQVGFWRDTPTLWARAEAVTRENDVAHGHLAQYNLRLGVPEKAELHFAEAVRIQPDNGLYRASLGAVQLAQGKVQQATEHLEVAVARAPQYSPGWHNLGMARMRLQQPGAAVDCFREEIRLVRKPVEAAEALAALGWAQWESASRSDAVDSFESALHLDSEQGEAWHGLGYSHLVAGRLDDAEAALKKAVQFNPSLVRAYSDLGLDLGRQGNWAQDVSLQRAAGRMQHQGGRALENATGLVSGGDAVSDLVTYACRLAYAHDQLQARADAKAAYDQASRIDPEWPIKFTARAWKLATDSNADRRDPQLAFELASQAVASSADASAQALDALAAAQAALGRFSEAIKTAKLALAKADAAKDAQLSQAIAARIRCYEKQTAFIQPPSSKARGP